MKRRSLYLLLPVFVFVSCVLSSAYSQSKGPFSIYAGASVPLFEFVKSNGNDVSFAKVGYAVSLEHVLPLEEFTVVPLRLLTTATLCANTFDEQVPIKQLGFPATSSVIESGSYYSLTLLTGPQYQLKVSSDLSFTGGVQVGMLVGFTPAYEVATTALSFSQSRASSAPQFAYGLTGGCQIGEIMVSVKYFHGVPTYNVTQQLTAGSVYLSQDVSIERPRSTMLILVGFGF